jgi:LCP family protein required for cell wall assembly
LVGYSGFQAYEFYATKPLGAAVPQMTPLSLPATWTPGAPTPAGTQLGAVTLAPTVSFDTPTAEPICGGNGVMNVLVVGADSRTDSYQYGLSDAIRVVRVDYVTRRITVLEFPRDLWVEIPFISDNLNGQDHEKLNQAYLYGQPGDGFHYWDDPSAGPGLLALTLNINFGVVINHYVAVNMQTFVHVVDSVGGIDVNVKDEDMALQSGLPIGEHHLKGSEALRVARNRVEGGFARGDNQNLVLCALRKKVLSPKVVTKIPDLIETFSDNIVTDFTPEQLGQLACLGKSIPAENISLVTFPEEYFTQSRIYDPVFKKNVFVWDVDFDILRDYTSRFQAGTWPPPPLPAPEDSITSPETNDSGITCE